MLYLVFIQEELEMAESGPESMDLKLAQEAQDREYARALQVDIP